MINPPFGATIIQFWAVPYKMNTSRREEFRRWAAGMPAIDRTGGVD